MSNIPQQETIVQYIANSAQTEYTFAFYAPLNTDIKVYYQAANATPVPADDLLVLNVDYTVTFNASPIDGGYITLLFAPTTGYYLTIDRFVEASLNTNFSLAQNFNGANLDAALARLLLLDQQNQNYALQRNLSYIINTYLPNATPYTQLPPLGNQQIWIGSGDGVAAATLEENPDVSTLRSELANNAPGTDGARLVGYYDSVTGEDATTLNDYLTFLPTYINTVVVDKVQDSEYIYGTDTSVTPNILTVNLQPSLTEYKGGQFFIIRPNNSNTGPSTININELGAKSIHLVNELPLQAGDIFSGTNMVISYDGTNFQLLNPQTVLTRKFAGASMSMSAGVSIPSLSIGKLPFNTIVFDTNNWCEAANNRILPQISGYVRVNTSCFIHDVEMVSVQGDISLAVYKNGVFYGNLGGFPLTGFAAWLTGTAIVPVNGSTDYIEIFGDNQSNDHAITFGNEGIFQLEFIGR